MAWVRPCAACRCPTPRNAWPIAGGNWRCGIGKPGWVPDCAVASLVAGGAGSPLGVLALQGDVREHVAALTEVGVASRLVKRVGDLDGLAGCVLPGGESTTLSMLLESTGLWDPLGALIEDGLPVLGTCAGLVLLAREVLDGRPDQRSFGALDVVVRRNGFGRQLQSFEAVVDVGDRLGGPGGRDGASPVGAPPARTAAPTASGIHPGAHGGQV